MFSAFLLASLAVAAVTAVPTNIHVHNEGRGCGTRHPSQEENLILNEMTKRFVTKTCSADPTLFYCDTPQAESVVVNVKFAYHIIHDGRTGNQTDEDVQKPMDVLNNDYGGRGNESSRTSFQFNLTTVTRTDNAQWFGSPTRYEREFKEALSVSPADTMNNYFTDMTGGLLGWCYFPSDFPEDSSMHGCVNLYSSIPDGGASPYDGGQTVVHEIGHGFGLYHVFQGGSASCAGNCQTTGDQVCDTPPQATSTSGCPQNKDSCPGDGEDNVHNYLDYSYDACMSEFTPGQSERMDQQIALHKPGYLGPDLVNKIKRAAPDAWDEVRMFKKTKLMMHRQ